MKISRRGNPGLVWFDNMETEKDERMPFIYCYKAWGSNHHGGVLNRLFGFLQQSISWSAQFFHTFLSIPVSKKPTFAAILLIPTFNLIFEFEGRQGVNLGN